MKKPLKNILPSLSERIGQALFGPGAETVQRDSKSGDSHSRHVYSFLKFLVAFSILFVQMAFVQSMEAS